MSEPIEQIDSDIQAALDAPSMSDWLHDALLSALQRDCVDAACDAHSGCVARPAP
jgi:hypothetical protein